MKKEKIEVYKLGGAFFVVIRYIVNFFNFFKDVKNRLYVISAVRGITRILDTIVFIRTQKGVSDTYKKKLINYSLLEFKKIHLKLIKGLFKKDSRESIEKELEVLCQELERVVYGKFEDEDMYYASVLKFGELASSKILSAYMNYIGIKNTWMDAREYVLTNSDYREAKTIHVKGGFKSFFSSSNPATLVTQGFIGSSITGVETVTGYNGGDKSGADFAEEVSNDLKLEPEMSFFKDVKGVLKGDPKKNSNLEIFDSMTFEEYFLLVEETGTYVVRPDAITGLAKKNIRTRVRSYIDLNEPGTLIHN